MSESDKTAAPYLLRVAAVTDTGRVREKNEDAHVVACLGAPIAAALDAGTEASFDPTRTPVLLAVSDGMGGAAAGEVASALTVEVLRRSLPPDSPHWTATLRDAVLAANRAVWTEGQLLSRRGMGATLTAVAVHGLTAHVAEVGDSRAYLLREGVLTQLTRDQSYVQMLVDSGVLTPEEAQASPLKNIIASAMGQKEDVRVDIGHIRLALGDKLLVCCDGLSNEVPDDRIRAILTDAASPSAASAQLVAVANDNGGNDNITVVVAVLEAAP